MPNLLHPMTGTLDTADLCIFTILNTVLARRHVDGTVASAPNDQRSRLDLNNVMI
jgi:hypothetical protein